MSPARTDSGLVRQRLSRFAFILSRIVHHGGVLLPACLNGIRWQCLRIFA
jgi:hypothetical protein